MTHDRKNAEHGSPPFDLVSGQPGTDIRFARRAPDRGTSAVGPATSHRPATIEVRSVHTWPGSLFCREQGLPRIGMALPVRRRLRGDALCRISQAASAETCPSAANRVRRCLACDGSVLLGRRRKARQRCHPPPGSCTRQIPPGCLAEPTGKPGRGIIRPAQAGRGPVTVPVRNLRKVLPPEVVP
jgi:hypothetical protein